MRVWRCIYCHAQDGTLLSWHASRRAAAADLARLRRENGPEQGPAEVELVEIPTTRAGLIDWLNRNLQGDNG